MTARNPRQLSFIFRNMKNMKKKNIYGPCPCGDLTPNVICRLVLHHGVMVCVASCFCHRIIFQEWGLSCCDRANVSTALPQIQPKLSTKPRQYTFMGEICLSDSLCNEGKIYWSPTYFAHSREGRRCQNLCFAASSSFYKKMSLLILRDGQSRIVPNLTQRS